MKLVDLSFFIELGAALEQAKGIDPKGHLFDAFFPLLQLRNLLTKLQVDENAKLAAAAHDFSELVAAINGFEKQHFRDGGGRWVSPSEDDRAEFELTSIISKIEQFRTVMIADLRINASFTVTKSGIFDVNELVSCAHKILSPLVILNVEKDVLAEIDAAGKCLAFNLPTACGFHAMRAVERVIKRYLGEFFPLDEIKHMKNWGQYIAALERRINEAIEPCPSEESVDLLKHIKDIYRNPVIHPERSLKGEEASTLFHSTAAAINRIISEIVEKNRALPNLIGKYYGAAALVYEQPERQEAANAAA